MRSGCHSFKYGKIIIFAHICLFCNNSFMCSITLTGGPISKKRKRISFSTFHNYKCNIIYKIWYLTLDILSYRRDPPIRVFCILEQWTHVIYQSTLSINVAFLLTLFRFMLIIHLLICRKLASQMKIWCLHIEWSRKIN